MIEMSVDKETAGNTQGSAAHLQLPSERTGSYDNDAGTTLDPGGSSGSATCPAPPDEAPRTQSDMAQSHPQDGCVEEGARPNENRPNATNGVQQPAKQQQKVSKRRGTTHAWSKNAQPGGKRRRRAKSESDSVLPTNFLLGGNIFDPLNLNSLLDEEVNRALNAETPKSSPLPSKHHDPVEILVPRDITDPLNLNSRGGSLVSPFKSGGRSRNRNRHHGGGARTGGAAAVGGGSVSDSEKGGPNASTSSLPSSRHHGAWGGTRAGGGARSGGGASSIAVPLSAEEVPGGGTGGGAPASVAQELDRPDQREEAARPQHGAPAAGPGARHQHSSRPRKRRRKAEPPPAQSWGEDRGRGGGGGPGTGTQASHAPGGAPPRPGPGGGGRNQRSKQQKFHLGNYSSYYGYRNPGASEDPRFRVLRPEWFQGKEVLDVGCNTGQLTLTIAKRLRPARILGLDIDGALVRAARQNVRHYLSELEAQDARRDATAGERPTKREREAEETGGEAERERRKQDGTNAVDGRRAAENGNAMAAESGSAKEADSAMTEEEMKPGSFAGAAVEHLGSGSFPMSLRISRGPIAAPPLPESPTAPPGVFPANVSFVKINYVLQNDALVATQRPEYDVILCLSVTKWVHLNWGDAGLKRLFQRAYRHLRPGGRFILEPQPWETYGKRKLLTDNMSRNYHSIRLRPDQFSTYLTTEVGFCSYELIGTPKNLSKGFQRPIYLFHK